MARLLDIGRVRFLVPFLGREQSVAGAARDLDVSLPRMAYQARQLLDVGLLQITRDEPRAGRPVRYYRSVADELLVALTDVGDGDLEQHLLDSEEPMRRALVRAQVDALTTGATPADRLAVRVRRAAPGGIDVSPCRLDGADLETSVTTWSSWLAVPIAPEDTAELLSDLDALWRKWRNKHTGTRVQIIRLATAPLNLKDT